MPTIVLKEQQCQIVALGLRKLVSTGLLPVRKAFVSFNLKTILPPLLADAVDNVSTQPSESGPNPNINTIVSFDVSLPVDGLYCPRMSCEVFDQLFSGLAAQPHVGTFTLPIQEFIEEQRKDDKELMYHLEAAARELAEIAEAMRKKDPANRDARVEVARILKVKDT